MMYPTDIRKAIDNNWPVILPLGVLEYHGEHCVLGVDTLVVVKAIEELEKENNNIVILPPFYYGASSYVVESPERNGSVHVGSEALNPFAKQLFTSLLRIGFKNITAFIHHQSENFTAGMPTDLAFKLAGRQAIFEHLEKIHGKEDWWGDNKMKDYYKDNSENANPFNWIRILPFMDEETQKLFPIDHTGKQESSLMMAFCPEGIDMSKNTYEKWYMESAKEANSDYATSAKKMIMKSLKERLGLL